MVMGEAMKNEVKIPVWMFSIILALLLAILGFNASFAGTVKQVQVNTKAIEQLQDKKADQSVLLLILEGQKRIEGKLDQHISQK